MAGPSIDVMDQTFVVAAPSGLAAEVAQPELWRTCWPTLALTVAEDRGAEGIRWVVDGEVSGTGEIWLEPWGDGVIVHWFLRAEPGVKSSPRRTKRLHARLVRTYKSGVHALKDRVEYGRPAGMPRIPVGARARTDLGSPSR